MLAIMVLRCTSAAAPCIESQTFANPSTTGVENFILGVPLQAKDALPRSLGSLSGPQPTEKPERYENHHYQAEDAADPGTAVAAVGVVPTASAE